MKELKPCPFCGGTNLETGDNWASGDGYVHCYGCGGHLGVEGDYRLREEEAIRRWNVRISNLAPNVKWTAYSPCILDCRRLSSLACQPKKPGQPCLLRN
ncbi:MAG: Lar family restriction alleviation protein [Dechloromonas sp.]|nr:Lar family restriction alleviation protein [Dechloromonas sp.]